MITISIIIIIISTLKEIKRENIRSIIITVLIISIIIASRESISSITILSGLFETENSLRVPVMGKSIRMISKIGIYIIIIGIIIIIGNKNTNNEFLYIMYLFAILGMILVINSNDLIAALIAIELQSLALYILNIKSNKRAISAGVMYYIMGSISSVILIIGIVITYKNTGGTSITNTSIIVIISLLIKIGAAPFHNWVADVYNGLMTERTIIIGSLGKISIIILISKIITIPAIIIVITLIIGAVGGLGQYRLKRIIGYSSINHVGWMLIGNTSESRFYVYQYFISFIIIMGSIKNTKSSTSIIITIFSLAGIPPLIGFIGKLQVLFITVVNGKYIITIILIITSVISAVYYLRMIINLNKYEKTGKKTLIMAIMTIYQVVYIIL